MLCAPAAPASLWLHSPNRVSFQVASDPGHSSKQPQRQRASPLKHTGQLATLAALFFTSTTSSTLIIPELFSSMWVSLTSLLGFWDLLSLREGPDLPPFDLSPCQRRTNTLVLVTLAPTVRGISVVSVTKGFTSGWPYLDSTTTRQSR